MLRTQPTNGFDKDEQIRVLTAAVSSLKSTLMKKTLSAASGSKKFTGNCHSCRQPGHMLNDCEKLKAKRRMILRPASVGKIRTRMISRELLSLLASLLTTLTLHLPPPTTLLRVKRGNLEAYPEAYPSIKTRRSDPFSGMMYNSEIAIENCDLSDSGPPDLATPYRHFWVSLRSNFHVDTPPAPGVRPVHSPEPARVTVEDFELPTHSFGTPSPVTPAPALVGLSHHEKRRIRKEARIASRNRFTPPVDIPSPIDDLLSSDSDDDSDWSTDSDASGVPAADPPAFDRRRLHLRARAIRRARMLRASPKSRTYFAHLMQRVAGEDNRSFFGRKQSPVCRPASVLRFAARWRALYAALQMEDSLAGHPLAMAFPAQKPGFWEAKRRCSRHRWLVDSGANNHMVTDTTECSGAVTPTYFWSHQWCGCGCHWRRELSHHCDH